MRSLGTHVGGAAVPRREGSGVPRPGSAVKVIPGWSTGRRRQPDLPIWRLNIQHKRPRSAELDAEHAVLRPGSPYVYAHVMNIQGGTTSLRQVRVARKQRRGSAPPVCCRSPAARHRLRSLLRRCSLASCPPCPDTVPVRQTDAAVSARLTDGALRFVSRTSSMRFSSSPGELCDGINPPAAGPDARQKLRLGANAAKPGRGTAACATAAAAAAGARAVQRHCRAGAARGGSRLAAVAKALSCGAGCQGATAASIRGSRVCGSVLARCGCTAGW